jgi:phosphoribosylformylglycinamidine synthase
MTLPIAHGEGRFVTASPAVLERLKSRGQVALTYTSDVNGSEAQIAGVCDRSGRVFGLMPHPERYLDWTRHPFWTRLDPAVRRGDTPGLAMFRNAVRAASAVRV